jgi:hypothetical protein
MPPPSVPLPSLNQSFMALKSPFTPPPVSPPMPAIIAVRHPPRAPIKGEPPPRSTPHHSPSPSPPLPHQNTPPTKLRHRHHFTLVAWPLLRSSSSGESRGESPITPFPFPAAVGEHRQAGAPSRSLFGGFPVRSAMWVHRGPARSCGPRSVDQVHGFFHCKINQKNRNSIFPSIFAKKPLSFFVINPQSLILQLGPRNGKIIPKRSLASEKSTKIALKLQNSISFQPQLQI